MAPQHGATIPPMFVPKKSTVAPAAVDTDQVELRDMIASTPPPELALKDDVMKLAMHGDEIGLRALLDAGSVSADFRDDEGLSPLHARTSCRPPSLPQERYTDAPPPFVVGRHQ